MLFFRFFTGRRLYKRKLNALSFWILISYKHLAILNEPIVADVFRRLRCVSYISVPSFGSQSFRNSSMVRTLNIALF